MLLCMLPAGATAMEQGDARVTIGADLDAEERTKVYADFGIEPGDAIEITVTNADERAYLEGIAPEKKIGKVALSCTYIVIGEPGSGLQITTKHINWCTSEMYINALTTAGITDAKVIVTAPFDVSGTAALTGIYKAYEDITGSSLNEIAKAVGVEELITTGNLAEYIGSEEATQLVNGLKEILDQTQTMTDEEVKAEIDKLCETYNVSLNDSQKNQLVSLCRSLEKLDTDELKDKLVGIAKTVDNAGKIGQTVSKKVLVAQSEIPKTNHEYNASYKVIKDATCTEKGTIRYYCVCGKTKDEELPLAEHEAVIDKAVAATCTKEGKTQGSHCDICNKVIIPQETVPKTDHIAVTDKAVAPTCVNSGKTEGSHCSVCKKVLKEQETIAATGKHKLKHIAEKKATESSSAMQEHWKCSVCDQLFADEKGTIPYKQLLVKDETPLMLIIGISVGALLLIGGAVTVIILILKKKSGKNTDIMGRY